jgi:hypothetical protein
MQIAEIFGKNHATIINGLRVHRELLSYKDADYISETKIISEYLGDSKFLNDLNLYKRKKVYDLRQDVLNSTNFQHVKRIQRRIKLGFYEKKEESIVLN